MIDNKPYQVVDKALLGFGGQLYPVDMQIEARGADVPEIRRWSNINEKDVLSVATNVTDMLTSCLRVTSTLPATSYAVKDIYEHDKIALLLIIHGLTFMDDLNNNLFVKGKCDNGTCKKEFPKLVVQPSNLTYQVPDTKYLKYIDKEEGMFKLKTKNFGDMDFKPSTIGLGQSVMAWISTFEASFVRDNQNMFKLVQSLFTDWRLANAKSLRKAQIEEYNSWNEQLFAFRLNLFNKLNIAVKEELEYICPECGSTFHSRMAFIGGYSKMFIPVQGFDDELL